MNNFLTRKLMHTLIVYYSLEGNTKLIAEAIAKETGADILELKPKKEISSKGFMRYVWGGRQVIMKETPELLPFEKNLQKYDLIFIGTPVWAGSFAPALKSFFVQVKIENKKVALFISHGGGPGKTMDRLKAELKGNEIVGEIDFRDPKKHDSEKNVQLAKAWARGILDNWK